MTIAAVRLAPYRLPLREPWPSAEGEIRERDGCLIALVDGEGRIGWGDAAPFPGFGLETIASCVAALRTAARRLVGIPREDYRAAAEQIAQLAPVAAAPAARHAIDLALHDLAAQTAGCSVAALLGGAAAAAGVDVNAAIPRLAPARAADEARRAVDEGVRTLKVKVGGPTLADDLARVRAVREAAGAGVRIRIDANQSWREREAVEALTALRVYDLEFAEQPVAAADLPALARVRREAGVPVAADESASSPAAARRVLEADAADVLIVKPMVLGGLAAARHVARLAKEHGAAVVVTTLLESAVGRAGAVHFAASLGPSPYAHGVATGSALGSDVGEGPRVSRGRAVLSDSPGLGIRIDPAVLERATLVEAA